MSSLPMGDLNASTRPWSVAVDMNTSEVFGVQNCRSQKQLLTRSVELSYQSQDFVREWTKGIGKVMHQCISNVVPFKEYGEPLGEDNEEDLFLYI